MSEIDNHILAIYTNKDRELEDAVQFLKIGLDNNEATLLIINENTCKKEVLERIHRKCYRSYTEINTLQSNGDLSILTSSEWHLVTIVDNIGYVSNDRTDDDNIQTRSMVDKEDIRKSWTSLIQNAKNRGKSGVRVFVSTGLFFRLGVTKDILEFLDTELMPSVNSDFPITAVCAYQANDLLTYTNSEAVRELSLNNPRLLIDNSYNDIIEKPPSLGHIAVLYDNEDYRDAIVSDYINEGLKRGQVCVYASIRSGNEEHLKRIKSRIINFADNIKDDNLLIINLSSYYISALTGDLSPFDRLKDDIIHRTKDRKDKHVRIVADCAPFLYQNSHFDESIELENWWHQKPIEGSYLCPYRKSLIDTSPYDYHRYRVFASHDTIIDEHAEIIGSFIWRLRNDVDSSGELAKSSYKQPSRRHQFSNLAI